MKKFFSFLSVAFISILSVNAATFTFSSADDIIQTADGYTLTLSKGSGNNAPFFQTNNNANEMRLYAGNTITVSGQSVKDVRLAFSKQGSKDYASLTASTGTLTSAGASTSNTDIRYDQWKGDTESVTFTVGTGQRIILQVVVNGDGSEPDISGPQDGPDTPDTPPALDPDYQYAEPTAVGTPNKTVQGEAYTFVDYNIQVDCTRGAITGQYFSVHAGFDISFTATQPIKGLVINGMVKKDFEATCDNGKISYLSPDTDSEADPVVVITDIDAKSVTISCSKQLRCYDVEVYFDANPEASVEGGSSGDTTEVVLTFDSAEAVYESEYVEMIDEENYSIFLFNEESYDYPYLSLDIYPASKDDLSGKYSVADETLGYYTYYQYGESDYDTAWAEEGEITIKCEDDTYTITGWLLCDNNTMYNISFSGYMPIYLDKDYYGDGNGVETIEQETNPDLLTPAYDLQGRRVGNDYRGIVIRNGRKQLIRK